MQQRSPQPTRDPQDSSGATTGRPPLSRSPSNRSPISGAPDHGLPTIGSPTNIRPAPDDQLQRLSMLEGSARLRVAEQRVRDGLVDPRIDVQRPSDNAPLRAAGKPRGVVRTSMSPQTSSFRARWVRMMLVLLALALLGSALALKLFK